MRSKYFPEFQKVSKISMAFSNQWMIIIFGVRILTRIVVCFSVETPIEPRNEELPDATRETITSDWQDSKNYGIVHTYEEGSGGRSEGRVEETSKRNIWSLNQYPDDLQEYVKSKEIADLKWELLRNYYGLRSDKPFHGYEQSSNEKGVNFKEIRKYVSVGPDGSPYYITDSGQHESEPIGDSFYEEKPICKITHESCAGTGTKRGRARRCLCQEECREYGNCCLDYQLGKIDTNSKNNKRWSCTKVKEGIAYYVVTSCPDHYENKHVISQCEVKDFKHNQSDSFLKIPVTSSDTLITYRNVYCSICNGELNASFWTTELDCPKSVRIHTDAIHQTDINGCTASFTFPKFRFNTTVGNSSKYPPLIRCDSALKSECSENWMTTYEGNYAMEISTKCALIYAPVSRTLFPSTIKYKNKFCAICNDEDDVGLMCPASTYLSKPNTVQPALSLLLDMDFTQGGSVVGSQERCPKMHLYDPWRNLCRNLMCGWHYVYENGKCIFNPNAVQNASAQYGSLTLKFNGTLQSDCLRTLYSADEVSLLENGTIIILNGGDVLTPEQYEKDENSSITVCVNSELDSNYVPTFTDAQGWLTRIGLGISLVSLLSKIGFSLFSSEKKKLPTKIVLFLSVSLFFAQLLFLFGIYKTNLPLLCQIMGILLHYCFLSSFFWMNVLAFDIWKTFASCDALAKSQEESIHILWYCFYGWLSPLAIVLTAVLFNWVFHIPLLNPNYGQAVCWISNKVALAVFFGTPLAVLLLANFAFFIATAVEIRKTAIAAKFAVQNTKRNADRVQFSLYCKLACIMGLTWLFGFFAAFSGSTVLWYLFIVFNSIQGVYVLLAFTHFKFPKWFKPKNLLYMSYNRTTVSRSSVTLTSSISKT